jgi:hypothetical protein
MWLSRKEYDFLISNYPDWVEENWTQMQPLWALYGTKLSFSNMSDEQYNFLLENIVGEV